MTINRHNYEAFLVDYLDGELQSSLVGELLLFLEQNPDIKNEYEGMEDAVLVSETYAYPYKSDLKKKSFSKNGIDNELDYLFIASIEGVITDDEKVRLDSELNKNQGGKAELNLYKKTIIQPSQAITLSNKSRLKRATIIPLRYSTLRRTFGIAASIGLLIGIYTIGKMMVNVDHIDIPSKINTIASTNPPTKVPANEQNVVNKPSTVNTSVDYQNRTTPHNKTFVADDVSKTEEPRREEIIPSKIERIETKEIVIWKNTQYEQIALYIDANPLIKDFSTVKANSYSDNNIARSSIREIGVFEILQYGVQSFGKLINRDIRLNADKDKKGRIEKISFESNLIAFSAPIRKKE